MSMTEQGLSLVTSSPTRLMIARCLWCVQRVGKERLRIDGVWQHDAGCRVPETDGICPECMSQQLFLLRHSGKQLRD
jgi:hypothetical protein